MDHRNHSRQVESAAAQYTQHTSYTSSDLTNSATLPFPSNDAAAMANLTYPPADLSEADDNVPEEVPVHATATTSTRGRGRGRGRVYRGKGKIAKPAPVKPTSGRGRRHKVYESVRAQAAHERIQELKSAFATVAKAVKPAVQEIADRNLNQLGQDPSIYKKVPEYEDIENFLTDRLAGTKKTIEMQYKTGTTMLNHLYQAQQEATHDEFTVCSPPICRGQPANMEQRCITELCDERYDQLMLQLDILEHLYDNKMPIDVCPGRHPLLLSNTNYAKLPAKSEEGEYLFKEISQKQYDEQSGPYVEFRDGVEVPFPGRLVSKLMTKEYQLQEDDAPAKRKADGQPEGQPNAKIAATAESGEPVPSMPRHAGGLLSAVDALDERSSTPAESTSASNAATPAPETTDAHSPKAPASGEAILADEIPLPKNVSAADEFGVRLVARRATRMDIPNNRIMVPNVFEWDDLDIGFRDSANCVQKGASKAKRGKYLSKPGSNFMFIDRRVGTWDSTQAAGEFDEALVKKHGLHPTLGIVLPSSINDEEPPRPYVDGWKPAALVSPRGQVVHASRTIPPAKQDRRVRKLYRRLHMKQILQDYCKQECVEDQDIGPTKEEREEYRRATLIAHGIDPDALPPQPSPQEPTEPAPEDKAAFGSFVEEVINAASVVDAEEEDTARNARSKRAPSSQASSRPYDAIRDVFTDNGPAVIDEVPEPAPRVIDTTGLSALADMAEYERQQEQVYAQSQYPPPSSYYPPSEMTTQLSYPPHAEPPMHEPPRTHDFMRTALNPPPSEYPPPPAMQDYPVGPLMSASQGQHSRTPFSNSSTAKPALPALRPMRGFSLDGTPLPEPHGSPAPQHPGMIVSNSGAFYPPAPSRPFHNGYSLQEHGPMSVLQPPMAQPPIGGPLQAPMVHQPERLGSYSASPPPYSGLGSAPVLQQPCTPTGMSSTSPHSRPGSSSAPSSSSAGPANAAGQSSKYRKLEPAPTPPHRLGYGGNGHELRTVQFDYKEAIKDYKPVEAPPRHGPTHIRGWTHNNLKKSRLGVKEEEGN